MRIFPACLLTLLLLAPSLSAAAPIIVEDSAARFEVRFDPDDQFGPVAPTFAIGGRTVEIITGGESASIAISVVFRDSVGDLEDLIFIFSSLTTDPFFPGPIEPGDLIDANSYNGFAGADSVTGDGLLPGFTSSRVVLIAGPDRDTPWTIARLVLENKKGVPEPTTLALLLGGVVALAARRRS